MQIPPLIQRSSQDALVHRHNNIIDLASVRGSFIPSQDPETRHASLQENFIQMLVRRSARNRSN